MTTKADYSKEEWQLLLDVPSCVGTAVMLASSSGLGSIKEAMALAKGTLGAGEGHEDNELVTSLVEARLKNGERSQVETLSSPYRGQQPDEIRQDTVNKCSQVAELLATKSTPQESGGYKQWALSVGQRVANSAKEGGFLGFGGERVSAEEKKVLDAVAEALGTP